jgi:hypothetical protein
MICSFCNQNLASFRQYRLHLIHRHEKKFDEKGNCKSLFVCKDNDCNSTFTLFSSFRRHYTKMHSIIAFPDNSSQNSEFLENDVEMVNDFTNNQTEPMETEQDFDQEMNLELGKDLINQIICELRCKTSLPHAITTFVVNIIVKIALILSAYLRCQVLCFLRSFKFDLNSPDVVNLINLFDVEHFFKNTDTFQKQLKHNLKHINYVSPEEIILGKRTDTVIRNNTNVMKEVKESFQYISIKSTLMTLFSNKSFVKLLSDEKPSAQGRYNSYIDGKKYKDNTFLNDFKNTVRINLYYDDVEVTNPIGSQSSVYKIACFYYTIQNATSMFNSKLENIFVLAVCYTTDLKKYGFERILENFLKEMEELESENGVNFYVHNAKKTIRATLISFIGDTLAAHDILGFSGPGSNRFCRECLVSRSRFHKKPTIKGKRRTVSIHADQLKDLMDSDYHHSKISKYGLKQDSVLNRLKNFHCSSSNVFDPMHDLLEGVVPFTIKCVLKHFIKKRGLFTIFNFNTRVNNFRYGVVENCNKPSPNFTMAMLNSKSKKLKQKSSQCWLLLRAFPFLVGNNLLTEDFKYLDLLSSLTKICAISFSTSLNDFNVCELDYLVKNYLKNFQKLFGDKIVNGNILQGEKMINKHHHLLHYARNILLKGPLALYSCMRFEGKHLPIKKQIVNAQNFVNVPKSVACRQSLLQSYNIKYNCFAKLSTMINSFKTVDINLLHCKNFIIEKIGLIPFIKKVTKCMVNGIEYRPNFVVPIIDEENDSMHPTFVIIKEIVEFNHHLYFACNYLNILQYSSLYNAFEIEESSDSLLLEDTNVINFNPVNIWKKYDSLSKFLNIKYCY